MKKLLIIKHFISPVLLYLLISSSPQLLFSSTPHLLISSTPHYSITGKCLDPNATGRVTLIAYNDNHQLDTIARAVIANGEFLLTGTLPPKKSIASPSGDVGDASEARSGSAPRQAYLLINERLKDYIPIILENADYQILLDGNVVLSLTGTDEQNVLSKYIETRIPQARLLEEYRLRPIEERRLDSIRSYYRQRDSLIAPGVREAQRRLLDEYPDRLASAVFFHLDLKEKGFQELTYIYDKLTGPGKDNPYARKMLERIETLKALEKGAQAPNFTMKTPEGTAVELYGIAAKVKIIDFWASWCYPCRKENPLMVELYKKYHDKGLQIVGISLDDDHKKWTDAIEKDGLPWIHVSELKKWKCQAVKLYDVKAVPHTVVLDSNNRVIARNVRGEQLVKLIASLLDNP